MKKLLVAALAAMVFTGMAHAQATTVHWVFDPVLFRCHNTTFSAQTGAFLDDGNITAGAFNAFDSTYASGIAKFDTTAGVATSGWGLQPVGSAVDSSVACRLFIYDAGPSVGLTSVTLGRTSATAESIYIKTQVSPDNFLWFDLAVIAGQAPVLNAFTAQTTINAAVITFVTSTNTGISGKMWSLPYFNAQNAAGLRHGMDISHVSEFPFVRWIISGTRATTNHSYKCMVGHLTSNQSKQPG